MKKIIKAAAALIALATLVTLSACGSKGSDGGAAATGSQAAQNDDFDPDEFLGAAGVTAPDDYIAVLYGSTQNFVKELYISKSGSGYDYVILNRDADTNGYVAGGAQKGKDIKTKEKLFELIDKKGITEYAMFKGDSKKYTLDEFKKKFDA